MPADHLRQTLSDLRFPLDAGARGEVRRSVFEYVGALKAQALPPEQVLVALKQIADEAGIRSSALRDRDGRTSRADLLMDMVAWSIEEYFRETRGAEPS